MEFGVMEREETAPRSAGVVDRSPGRDWCRYFRQDGDGWMMGVVDDNLAVVQYSDDVSGYDPKRGDRVMVWAPNEEEMERLVTAVFERVLEVGLEADAVTIQRMDESADTAVMVLRPTDGIK